MARPGQHAPRAITILQVYDALLVASGLGSIKAGCATLGEIHEVLALRAERTLDKQQTLFHLRVLARHGLAKDHGRAPMQGGPALFSPFPFSSFNPKGKS